MFIDRRNYNVNIKLLHQQGVEAENISEGVFRVLGGLSSTKFRPAGVWQFADWKIKKKIDVLKYNMASCVFVIVLSGFDDLAGVH